MVPDNNQYNQYSSQYSDPYGNQYSSYGSEYSTTQSSGLGQLADSSQLITRQTYNLILGGMLLYGFLVNCFMVKYCFDAAYSLASNTLLYYIVYFAMVIGGWYLIKHSTNTLTNFIGYNLIVIPLGIVVSLVVNIYSDFGYSDAISMAFLATAAITFTMMLISNIFQDVFLNMGTALGVTLLVVIVVELIMHFTGAFSSVIDYIVVGLFSLYIGYDWAVANRCQKTVRNAVYSAGQLYIDIINIFLRLIRIFARANRN